MRLFCTLWMENPPSGHENPVAAVVKYSVRFDDVPVGIQRADDDTRICVAKKRCSPSRDCRGSIRRPPHNRSAALRLFSSVPIRLFKMKLNWDTPAKKHTLAVLGESRCVRDGVKVGFGHPHARHRVRKRRTLLSTKLVLVPFSRFDAVEGKCSISQRADIGTRRHS